MQYTYEEWKEMSTQKEIDLKYVSVNGDKIPGSDSYTIILPEPCEINRPSPKLKLQKEGIK